METDVTSCLLEEKASSHDPVAFCPSHSISVFVTESLRTVHDYVHLKSVFVSVVFFFLIVLAHRRSGFCLRCVVVDESLCLSPGLFLCHLRCCLFPLIFVGRSSLEGLRRKVFVGRSSSEGLRRKVLVGRSSSEGLRRKFPLWLSPCQSYLSLHRRSLNRNSCSTNKTCRDDYLSTKFYASWFQCPVHWSCLRWRSYFQSRCFTQCKVSQF